jgi:hypothetical protein
MNTGRFPTPMLLFYSAHPSDAENRFLAQLGRSFPEARLVIYSACSDLVTRLIQPADTVSIAVVVLSGEEEIQDLLALRNVITDTAIVVMLRKESREIRTLARQLRPQCVGVLDRDASDVIPIMEQMMKVRGSQER